MGSGVIHWNQHLLFANCRESPSVLKFLGLALALPDNYYVNKLINFFFDRLFKAFYEIVCLFVPFMFQLLRHSSFIGYFWQLIFWKKKKHTHLSVFKNLKLVSYSAAFDFCFA